MYKHLFLFYNDFIQRKLKENPKFIEENLNDICASIQHTIVEILIKIRQKGIEGYGTERQIKPEIQRKMRRDSLLVIGMQLCIMLTGWMLLTQNGLFGDLWMMVGLTKQSELWHSLLLMAVELVLSYAIVWTIPLFFVMMN